MEFRYRDIVLDELSRHGVRPSHDTPPDLIHEFINDLYVIEIRALRNQVRAGVIRKQDLASRVKQLRKRYFLLSVPIQEWTERTLTESG
ncbi:MAG: hypothetical protein WAU45_06165 [Blastocatellia bacterium]